MKRTLTVMALVMCAVTAKAQPVMLNPDFGEVSTRELNLKVYPADSSAAAVVLYDEISVAIGLDYDRLPEKETYVHRRIKILQERGKDQADFKVLLNDRWTEVLTELRVNVYDPDAGIFKPSVMPGKYLFSSKVSGGYTLKSFSPPQVKAGSVIEVEYKIKSKDWYHIDDIVLQQDIPVNQVKATVSYPGFMAFNKKIHGLHKPIMSEEKEDRVFVFGGGYSTEAHYSQIIDTYILQDIPAAHEENFVFCPDLYRDAVYHSLSGYQYPGEKLITLQSRWEDIDSHIRTQKFWKASTAKSPFAKEIKTLAKAGSDEVSQVENIVKLVASKVRWNGEHSIWDCNTAEALKQQSGNSLEINAIAAAALSSAGFTCEPVFLALKDKGIITDFFIQYASYSSVLLKVTGKEGKTWYVDASDPFGYLNVLRPTQMVDMARVIPQKGNGSWVKLHGLSKNDSRIDARMDVLGDGKISGNASFDMTGSCSRQFKSDRNRLVETEKLTAGMLCNVTASNVRFRGVDEYGKESGMDLDFTGEAEKAGERLYVNPFIRHFHNASDMPDIERNCDIDFAWSEGITYTCAVNVPEGWRVVECPTSRRINCPFIKSTAAVIYKEEGNRVFVHFTFVSGDAFINKDYYPIVRKHWKSLEDIYNDMIILEKLPASE